jgi:hypothetical protein
MTFKKYQSKPRFREAIKLTEEHFNHPDCFGGLLQYHYPAEGKPFARIVDTCIDIPIGDYFVKTETGSYGMSRAKFFEDRWEPVPQTADEHIASWPAWKQRFAKQWLGGSGTNEVARTPVDNFRNNEW